MNIVKSLVVLLVLVTLIVLSIIQVRKCIVRHKNKTNTYKHIILTVCCVFITVLSLMFGGDYVYPFERVVDPVLIAECELPEEHRLDYPGQIYWRGAYEQFGLYADSFRFDPKEKQSHLGFEWPDMDFDNHCYIITYGHKIKKLSYNVWETIDDPIRTGAKVGHMVLEEEFSPDKVYVYEIPKVRIDNDDTDTYKKRDLDNPYVNAGYPDWKYEKVSGWEDLLFPADWRCVTDDGVIKIINDKEQTIAFGAFFDIANSSPEKRKRTFLAEIFEEESVEIKAEKTKSALNIQGCWFCKYSVIGKESRMCYLLKLLDEYDRMLVFAFPLKENIDTTDLEDKAQAVVYYYRREIRS